jgi:hypothetical protein
MYITFPWLGVIVTFPAPASVYPASVHVPTAALAGDGKENVRGTAARSPISKVETERSEVNLLNIAFNQDLPSLSARLL